MNFKEAIIEIINVYMTEDIQSSDENENEDNQDVDSDDDDDDGFDDIVQMIEGNSFDENELQYLIVFKNISKQLNRIKCAKVGVVAIEKLLTK